MHKLTVAFTGLVFYLFACVGYAASPALTEAQIRGFIASMPDLEAFGEKYPDIDNDDDDDDDPDFSRPISSSINKLRGHEAYKPFAQIVKRHGFSSPEQWGQVGDRVLRAMFAASMDETSADSKAQLAEVLKQIDAEPDLSPEQRAEMKEMIMSGMGFMLALDDVPQADIDAIRPHMAELQRMMNIGDE